jgi:hypothetical protein
MLTSRFSFSILLDNKTDNKRIYAKSDKEKGPGRPSPAKEKPRAVSGLLKNYLLVTRKRKIDGRVAEWQLTTQLGTLQIYLLDQQLLAIAIFIHWSQLPASIFEA